MRRYDHALHCDTGAETSRSPPDASGAAPARRQTPAPRSHDAESAHHDDAPRATAPTNAGAPTTTRDAANPRTTTTPRRLPTTASSPAILPFDFAAAFPTIDRRYIRRCLAAMRLPSGMRAAIDALYVPNRNFIGRPEHADAPT